MRSFKSLLMLGAMAIASASAWAFDSVNTLPKGQDTKTSYMLVTPRGALLADNSLNSNYLVTTLKYTDRTAATTDKSFQFLLFQSKDEAAGYYLYNVAVGKFVGRQSDTTVSLSDTPSCWYIFKNGQTFTNKSTDIAGQPAFNSVDYPWCVSSIEGEINGGAIAVSVWQSDTGTRTSGTSWDGGNHYQVVEAETVADDVWQVAHDKVVAYEATLGTETAVGFGGEIDPTNLLDEATKTKQEQAALDIINRFTKGTMTVEVILDLPRTVKDCDQYTYSATSDVLTVHASSAVAACRGFYDYVKAKGAGFCSWSGSRFTKPADMACDEVNVVTQFRDHQYFNVVTYGYTAPYWGQARWRQELDWMALHGVDMPLMLVGSEAIYHDVFTKDFGLTDEDVSKWEVGPAHLPWFRMGNLAGNSFDGPLGQEWYDNQRELAHYLLDEMDKLGMKPVCPAFGGFVPQAFSKTGTTPEVVGWNWCKPNDRNVPNYRLMPDDPKFVEVGKKFMERWEAEYGTGKYYLSDSFNEMSVPGSTSLLTQYGDNIFSIIKSSANPESVWVTQGWTFCYQYRDWGKTKFDALTKNVDDNRFIALYMSPEYAELYGHARDFDTAYQGFSGKGWNCTMLPNMGGKNFWTGNLNKYAKGYLNDLYNMADHGNIVGYGMTPEGVENNELLYELITDAGWTNPGKTIALDDWMEQYEQSRYGQQSAEMAAFHSMLRNTVYGTYKDHPRFAWQGANLSGGITGTAGIGNSLNNTFFNGVETLFSNAEALKAINTPLLEAELIEAAAIYVGAKIDKLSQEIKAKKSDRVECNRLINCLQELMLDFDAALELHPTWNLKRWEDMAQACGTQDAVRNAKNARRIVTVWFGNHTTDEAVQDYASRIWSGLMRDYYCPRLVKQLKSDCGIESFNRIAFENEFVAKAPYLSDPRPVNGDHIDFLVRLVNQAKNFGTIEAEPVDEFIASTDTENHWYALHPAANKDNALTATADNAALTVTADMMESSQVWRIVATGTDTYRLESRFGFNAAVVNGAAKTYLAPVNCDVRIAKAGDKLFTITPVAGTADLFSGNWTITETPASLVAEAASIDYTHYVRRLAGFTQTDIFGQPTEPKSTSALNAGIAQLQTEAGNIDHKTYDTFLSQWVDVKTATLTASDDAAAGRLAELIMGAHMIIVPADAQTSDAAANLFAAIQAAEIEAANGTNVAEAYNVLTEAILAYYAAGGAVTETDVESLVAETTGWKMKITAVFPDGTEHAVISNGTKLTAAATPSASAIVEFDVVKMNGKLGEGDATYVLKAGDQFIHWTSGDNTTKSEDLDGLNETYDPTLNVLTVKLGNETGLQPTSYDKAPIAGLYEILGVGTNGSTFNFTLREKDNEWIAGDPGQKFFDDNWDGIGHRTSFFRVELIEPEGPIFALNFDEDAEPTRAPERQITYVALTADGGSEQKFDVPTGRVYNDLTETAVFEVKAGDQLTGKIGYNGNWMHGYFYIDLDGDRNLTYNVNQQDQTGTELFSYSFWSGDLNQEQTGQNSLGQTLTGNNRNTVVNNVIALPVFTAPALPGDYNVRFKVDWNSVEPGGSTKQDIIGNGGYIVDAVLRVNGTTVGIERLQNEQNTFPIFDLQGRRVNAPSQGVYIMGTKRLMK